ncbi:MAG: hypothetical protein JKY54_13920 [Flavobacteriales bacterium]|nr:hypothetical protein [Flavobacteriales bacterium]
MFKKDHVLLGILWGLLLPLVFIVIVYIIFSFSDKEPTLDLMGQIVFLGIAGNILPAKYYTKKKLDRTQRGILAITMLEVVTWAIQFII